jgi:hypothetical protein
MLNKKLILSVIGGALLTISAQGFAAQQPTSQDEVIAREASEAPRGADNNNHRQRRGGRVMEDAGDMILSRRGADDPPGTERPGDNHRQRRGGKALEESDILAREGGCRRKCGAYSEDTSLILAREAGSRNRGRRGV